MHQINKQAGLGIVEVIVGLFVGLLVMLVVYGSFSFYQSTQRTAISGNSAFANLTSGLYLMANDVKVAGLGFSANGTLACTNFNAWFNGNTIADNQTLAPLAITDGGNNPDSLTIVFANSILAGSVSRLLNNMASPTSQINVNLAAGAGTGTMALLSNPGSGDPCTLIGITGVTNLGTSVDISHDAADSDYNPPNPATAYTNPITYPADSLLVNVGDFSWFTWRINNNQLEKVDNLAGTTSIIADNIIQMRAEYGVTDGINPNISQWVGATGEWSPLDAAHISRIRAVRIALVARSAHREKSVDAQGICNTTTTAPIPWTGGASFNLNADANWRCYRYRVLKTVLPLKNVVWGGA